MSLELGRFKMVLSILRLAWAVEFGLAANPGVFLLFLFSWD
jgi:hypothetical protein